MILFYCCIWSGQLAITDANAALLRLALSTTSWGTWHVAASECNALSEKSSFVLGLELCTKLCWRQPICLELPHLGPVIGSAGSKAFWVLYLANLLADFGMLTRYTLPAMVASAFLSQSTLPFLGGIGRHYKPQGDHAKIECLSRRVALLLGPWLGVLIASFEGCVCFFLAVSAAAAPLLLWDQPAMEIQPMSTGKPLMLKCLKQSPAKWVILFISCWQFFLAFNMLLASLLSNAQPCLLATIASTCCVGELLGAKVSFLGELVGQRFDVELCRRAGGVARTALTVVALSRLSAFLTVDSGDVIASTSYFSSGILLLSLFVSILAARLLSDLQSDLAYHVLLEGVEGGTEIHKLEQPIDALAGVAGPLYVRSVATHHGLGTAMAGLCILYFALVLFIQTGLNRIISPLAETAASQNSKES